MFGFLKRLFGRKRSPDPVALVLIEPSVRLLSAGHIAHAVSQALGKSYPESEVREESPIYYRLNVEGYELTVLSMPAPYIPKSPPHPELRLRDAIDRHEAAVVIDCWSAPEGKDRKEATGLMGKIVAHVVDESSLAVFCFHTQRLNLVDEMLLELLREGKALEAMETVTFDPISSVDAEGDRMVAAVAEARARWPEFAAAFAAKSPNDDRPFLFKAPFGEGERCEHMWVQAEAISDQTATGILLNDPLYNHGLKRGKPVTVPVETVSDWAYPEGEGFAGMFSDAIVRGV